MTDFAFVTVDVFTDRRFGGNPLAVFPDARGLADADMQVIAAEFNLSETTFVLPPKNPRHTARVRIFTPKSELPFAGHPNVGTGYVLADRFQGDAPLTFEEAAGLVEIRPLRDLSGSIVGTEILAPQPLSTGPELDPHRIAECVGLQPTDLVIAHHRPLVATVGAEFIIAEVTDLQVLADAQPDLAAFRSAAAEPGASSHFSILLYLRLDGGGNAIRMRMFAPLIGVLEDPATGSAAAALSAFLAAQQGETGIRQDFVIEQGIEMGRPSRLQGFGIRHADGSTTAGVGGRCVTVMQGTLRL